MLLYAGLVFFAAVAALLVFTSDPLAGIVLVASVAVAVAAGAMIETSVRSDRLTNAGPTSQSYVTLATPDENTTVVTLVRY